MEGVLGGAWRGSTAAQTIFRVIDWDHQTRSLQRVDCLFFFSRYAHLTRYSGLKYQCAPTPLTAVRGHTHSSQRA